MPFNLWILPIISGYYLITTFVYLKYTYQRLTPQQLLLRSIIWGISLFVLVYLLRIIFTVFFPDVPDKIYSYFYTLPITPVPFLLTSLFTFIFTLLVTNILNLFLVWVNYFNRAKPVEKAVDMFGNEVEKLFKDSATKNYLVQLNLKNNKVYIGFIAKIPPPKQSDYYELLPVLSGFRDDSTKKLNITTDYSNALNKYQSDLDKYSSFNMNILVKADQILSARAFDPDIFSEFNS